MRHWWGKIRPKLFAHVAYAIVRCLGITYRLEVIGEEALLSQQGGRILAGWHGRTLLAALHFRKRRWWALISHSRDGEMQNMIFTWLGFRTVRGSTGRGGARAAVECARLLRSGETFVFTPDGPRGPTQKVQKGILWLAQKGGATIFPAAASAKRRKLFKSWDSYMVPKPFSTCLIVIGPPITVPDQADEETIAQIELTLENELNRLQTEAETAMGHRA